MSLKVRDIVLEPIELLEGENCFHYHRATMSFPIRTCVICSEEFELKPDKPGFANRCPACSEPEEDSSAIGGHVDAGERQNESELNASRRRAIRDLLYRKDS